MARVLDLTTDDDAETVLEQTDASGLLGGGHLVDAPLSTHLADGETARYLVENKKDGLTLVAADGERRQYAPDGDYRAFALVTDRRFLFVVGGADGDETVSLPLADVLDTDTERAGVLSAALVLSTPDGRQFRFPCRGDLEAVVETVRDDAAAWSHAERLLEDADAAVERAGNRLDAGNHVQALAAMAEAAADWEEALETLEAVHPSAVQGLHERVAVRREMASRLRRQIRAAAGASAHASAQSAWDDGAYERAAAAYEDALDAYGAGRKRPGDEPTDDQLRRRMDAVRRERAILRAAPVADADAAARRAAELDDPEAAAEAWERAFDRFRAALELEWGVAGRRFAVDRDAARQSAADAATAAIDARLAAGKQWLVAGDELAKTEGADAAARAYRRARSHVERAAALAAEVRPDREADVETWLAAADDRLAGEGDVDGPTPDASLPADSLDDVLSLLSADDEATPSAGTGDETPTSAPATEPEPRETPAGASEASPVLADDGADDGAGDSGDGGTDESRDADEPTAGAPSSTDVAEAIDAAEDAWADAADDVTPPGGETADSAGSATDAPSSPPAGAAEVEEAVAGARDVDRAALVDTLRTMDDGALADLAAEVWSARGWATTVFAPAGDSIYDVVGVAPNGDERLLVWTCHRPEGGAIDRSVLDRIAATRGRTEGTNAATLVTTGTVPAAVRDRAAEQDVAVVDGEELCDLLVATDLDDAVLDVAT